jgi:GNAT superfamily N-acetyltransferase
MGVRRATPEDAPAIAEIHVRTWQVAYRDYFAAEYLVGQDRFLEEDSLRRREQGLANPDWTTFVAEEDGRILGFAVAYGNQDGLGPEVGELGAIYVNPDYWGLGIGTALIGEVEGLLAKFGHNRAILWTLGHNERTRRFYENRGWRFDGATKPHRTGAELVRYAKELAPLFTIREARPTDLSEIAEVHMLARQAAYAHFFPHDYLMGLTLEYCEQVWRERLSPPAAWKTLVAEEDAKVRGLASYGQNEQDLPADIGELLSLHISADRWEHGIGTALIRAAEHELRNLGFKNAVLWVYEQNERARRFYERRGWSAEGTRNVADRGGAPIVQLRYAKTLEP